MIRTLDPLDTEVLVIHAAPGTIVIYSDLVCSFAHLAVHRLHRTRAELGLEGAVAFDHRAFPLELFNEQVNPRPGVDSEIAVLGGLAPDAGWAMWHAPDWAYPSTVLPALEAVQAAKEQSWSASEVWESIPGTRCRSPGFDVLVVGLNHQLRSTQVI